MGNIILWALEHDTISVSRIKLRFSMGNRENGIMDNPCEMGLVTEKFANQPRKVLVESLDDIPQDAISLLGN